MDTAIKIQALLLGRGKLVEVGRSFGVFSKGWLTIKDNGESLRVIYTNGKNSCTYALGADFVKATGQRKVENGLLGAWESAISIWPVRDEERAVEVFNIVESHVDAAFKYNRRR